MNKFFIVLCLIGGFLIINPGVAYAKTPKTTQKNKQVKQKRAKVVVDFSKPPKKLRSQKRAKAKRQLASKQVKSRKSKIILKTRAAKSYWSFHCPDGFIRGDKVYCAKKGMSVHYDIVKRNKSLVKRDGGSRVAYKQRSKK